MIRLVLTDEEARWLRVHLDRALEDRSWDSHREPWTGGGNPLDDASLHARAVHDRLRDELRSQSWDPNEYRRPL